MKRGVVNIGIITAILILVTIFISCSNDKPVNKTFGIYLEENGKLVISDKHLKAYY